MHSGHSLDTILEMTFPQIALTASLIVEHQVEVLNTLLSPLVGGGKGPAKSKKTGKLKAAPREAPELPPKEAAAAQREQDQQLAILRQFGIGVSFG